LPVVKVAVGDVVAHPLRASGREKRSVVSTVPAHTAKQPGPQPKAAASADPRRFGGRLARAG